MKVDKEMIDRKDNIDKFLKDIKDNKNMLNKLSTDRLQKLERYYAKIIKENEIKIKKLES